MVSDKTFMGKPCKRGHSGLRYLTNRGCVECIAATTQAQQERKRQANQQQVKPAQPKPRGRKPGSKATGPAPKLAPKAPAKNHKYVSMSKPKEASELEGAETVEQFLARGGKIKPIPMGATAYGRLGADE